MNEAQYIDVISKIFGFATISFIVFFCIVSILKAIPVLFQKPKKDDTDYEYYITLEEVKSLRKHLRDLKFSASPDFWEADERIIQKCYEGVGPSHWSSKFKKFTAKCLNMIEGSLLIHDYEVMNSDKTLITFILINAKFLANVTREAKDRNEMKIVLVGVALVILNFLFGWKANHQNII